MTATATPLPFCLAPENHVKLDLGCQESNAPYTACNGTYVRINDTEATYSVPVQQKEYLVTVGNYSGLAGAETPSGPLTSSRGHE